MITKLKTFDEQVEDHGQFWSVYTNGLNYRFLDRAAAARWCNDMRSLYGKTSGRVGSVVLVRRGDAEWNR